MWDAVGQRCSGRCRGDLQPARRPLRPPRERGSPLEEAAHGGAGVVPPVVASGSAHCVGHPCSCSFVRRFPRRGPGAVGHCSPRACRLERPRPSHILPSVPLAPRLADDEVGGARGWGGKHPPYPCGLVPRDGRRGRRRPLGRGMPSEDPDSNEVAGTVAERGQRIPARLPSCFGRDSGTSAVWYYQAGHRQLNINRSTTICSILSTRPRAGGGFFGGSCS